ncbi:uncharacterized protein Dwil_GK11214 [Drosophila willistoni]|uniref:Probable ATP-dependent RNA helicase spindle-E n=1 Tax=Drosophila willistoni TaxID=7260 RepID=SPNE_DROWI|nr:probable ATP-dependent RNA helicase spindle-E [Drosophila willistoni]B4NBB0.1 RecName: Full=Probable ATP-dependent RNA helicase spindle-E; AltName: Full=Homeless [Drosophila willistoni]EDW81074.1 uncharacterized protein Dwil_GK11214 [Drosophila willistoni]
MDEDLMGFFDFSKEFKRTEAPKGCISSNFVGLGTEKEKTKPPKQENLGTEYVKEIVDREKQNLESLGIGGSAAKRNRTLDDIDSDNEECYEAPDLRLDEEFYSKYYFDLNRDKTLPIYTQRDQIMKAIRENTVVILKGETGCGKTTQVPQYIIDEAYQNRQYCNIVVTQPRRIAAISIANRVSQERHWEPGTVCSYQVGLHRQSGSEDARLLYCTTGVLLNFLINHKTLTHYTHIVLDEVHERDQEMDFLLIVVRRLLATNSRHVKVILMSATIDSREFVQYFATKNGIPPVINASHGRKYPLVKFYRDQLKNMQWQEDQPNPDEPGMGSHGYSAAIKILLVIDNMERRTEGQSQRSYEENLKTGSVLIFLPGINEIDNMAESIDHVMQENPALKVSIIRCHSLMTPDSQRDVFASPPVGYRKIILTTNIAESSITVPDVSYVIDFCLAKVLVTDTATNFSSLRLVWASKSNCRQRAGRVGRLRSGRVYRMVPKSFYMKHMLEFGVPEMLRSPLESSVLKAKELNMGPPIEMLALALSPPKLSDIRNTILLLKEVGALYPTVDGNYVELDGDLTPWGSIMTRLPLDIRLSRLVLLGYVFNCLDEAIVMAAGLSVRGLYLQEAGFQSYEAYWMHYVFADGSSSDLVAIWRFYKTYLNMCENRIMQESAAQWARRYHISLRSLKEMHLLVQELQYRCNKLRLHPVQLQSCQIKDDRERALILKILIAGAFYPNYFIRSNKFNPDYGRNTYQVLGGYDPCRTVYFTHFEPRYMGELYTRRIKDLFSEAKIPPENMDVNFQVGSEKIFVTFKQTEDEMDQLNLIQVPGRILTDVYKAVRLRIGKQYRPIRVMELPHAIQYVQENKIGTVIEGQWHPPSKPFNAGLMALPSVYDKNMIGYITHIVSCGKFFFQPLELADSITNMSEHINSPKNLSHYVVDAGSITKNLKLLAKRVDDFQRAQVIRVETHSHQYPKFRVRFIDYGDIAVVPMDQLRFMSNQLKREYDDLPPRCFECRLALVQPAALTSNYNRWPIKANEMVRKIAMDGRVEMEIYSLVNNVAAVFIKMREGVLNDKLVEKNYARRSDEDFASIQDHDFRLRKQERSFHVPRAERKQVNEEYLRVSRLPQDADLSPPPMHKCQTVVRLKGPYSPLEASMFSTIRASACKTVRIDPLSVNSVLLDSNPQDRHDQLIVSASVTTSNNNQVLTVRGSTVMPNTHGFGALMALIFCPTVQIKCNKECTKFVSLLAGLGYNPETMEPYYEDHDVVMNLDVNLLEDDVRLINQMRYNIDTIFFKYEGEDAPAVSEGDRSIVFNQLRCLLSRLLSKDRCYIEPHSSNLDNVWEKLDNLEPQSEPYGKRAIFPMHTIPELQNEDTTARLVLQENCKRLYSWRTFDGVLQPLDCKLCNQRLETVSQLRLHLLSQLHRDREKQIGFQDN